MTDVIRTVSSLDPYAVVELQGEIDLANAGDVGARLLEATPGSSAGLILDLTDVTYIDSAGVRTIFDLIRRLEDRRQMLGIALPEPSPLRALFKVARIGAVVPITETREACARALEMATGTLHD